MRKQEEVTERFREMRGRKLGEMKARLLARSYTNCEHNVKLNVRGAGKVGLCQNPILIKARGKPLVCNDDDFAQRCKAFRCVNTEQSVEDEFEAILKSPSRCGEELPKLAMLIWFLCGDEDKRSKGARLVGHLAIIWSEMKKVMTFKW